MKKFLAALLVCVATKAMAQTDNGYQCTLSCSLYDQTCLNEQRMCVMPNRQAAQPDLCKPSRDDLMCRLSESKPDAASVPMIFSRVC